MKVTLGKAGRVVIPSSIREQLSLSEGIQLEIVVRDNIIELHDPCVKVDELLHTFSKRLKTRGYSLVEALIEERRKEAHHEAT